MHKILAAIAIFVASVAAQTPPVSVTQPLQDFTVTTGQPYVIAWTNPSTATIPQIWLAQGDSNALSKIELIAQNVPTAPLSYTWNVDAKIVPGDYSLELGVSPNISYAGPFHIVAGSGTASTSAAGNTTTSATAASNSTVSSSSVSSSSATSSVPSSSSVVSSSVSTTAAASSSSSAPSNTTTSASASPSTSGAKAVAPIALLAIVPIALSFF